MLKIFCLVVKKGGALDWACAIGAVFHHGVDEPRELVLGDIREQVKVVVCQSQSSTKIRHDDTNEGEARHKLFLFCLMIFLKS